MSAPIQPTLSGLVDIADPAIGDIHLGDMAHHLALINRWGGATTLPLSVAQHSVAVGNVLPPPFRLYGYLHDAHEYLIGDITAPREWLHEIDHPDFTTLLAEHKWRLDQIIRKALGVPEPSPECLAAVAEADRRMAATEWRDLMAPACGPCPIPAAPYPRALATCLSWERAQDNFLMAVQSELAFERGPVMAAGAGPH